MSIGEQSARLSESIKVWSLCVRVPLEATDPVILVIDRDEEDVRLGC